MREARSWMQQRMRMPVPRKECRAGAAHLPAPAGHKRRFLFPLRLFGVDQRAGVKTCGAPARVQAGVGFAAPVAEFVAAGARHVQAAVGFLDHGAALATALPVGVAEQLVEGGVVGTGSRFVPGGFAAVADGGGAGGTGGLWNQRVSVSVCVSWRGCECWGLGL